MEIKFKWHIIFPIFLGITSLIDLGLTLIAYFYIDEFYEVNPLMRYILEEHGSLELSMLKVLGTIFLCFASWLVLQRGSKLEKLLLVMFGLAIQGSLMLWWVYWWGIVINYKMELFV